MRNVSSWFAVIGVVLFLALPLTLHSQTVNQERHAADVQGAPNTGIPVLFKQCAAASDGCRGVADVDYNGAELPREWTHFGDYGSGPTWQTYSYPNLFHFEDHRHGRDFHVSNNLGNFADGLGVFSRHTGNDPALGFTNQDAIGSYLLDAAPGSYSGYGTETTSNNLNLTSVIATKSIAHTIVSNAFHLGIGDFNQNAHYGHCWAGAINGDDEFCKNFLYTMDEGGFEGDIPMARIRSSQGDGTVGTFLQTENASLDHNRWWGAGRYAVLIRPDGKTDQPLFTLPITAVSPPSIRDRPMKFGTLTTTATIPASALSGVWGYTAPYVVPPNNDVAQPVNTEVMLDPAAPNYASGLYAGVACMWGAYRTEHVQITSVEPPRSGRQKISMLARYSPDGSPYKPTSAYLFQDKPGQQGFCQTGGRIQGYDKGFGQANQTVPLVGAIDAHTIVPSFNAKQGQHPMPVPVPLEARVKLTRAANVVILHGSTLDLRLLNDSSAMISGASDPSFNTASPVVFSNDAGAGTDIMDFRFTQPGTHPDVDLPISANLTVGTPGANVMRVYPMAEIIGTIDPAAEHSGLGDRLTTEPISFTYPPGAIIDSPAHYSGGFQLSSESIRTYQPGELLAGKTIEVNGQSLSDYFGTIVLSNTTPAKNYRGMGGTGVGPDGLHLSGVFTNVISLGGSKFFNDHNFDGNGLASGTAFLNFPCATGNCNNPNAFFELEQGDVKGAGWLRQLNQFTGTLTEGFTDGGYHFSSSLAFDRVRGVILNAPLALPRLGESAGPLCTGAGGFVTNKGCEGKALQTDGMRATRAVAVAPDAAIYDVTCDGAFTLTLPVTPRVWQHVNVINVGRGVCTVAAAAGIGNGALMPSVAVAAGGAGRYVFDGTVWRVE